MAQSSGSVYDVRCTIIINKDVEIPTALTPNVDAVHIGEWPFR
jgi:hypothetical protein